MFYLELFGGLEKARVRYVLVGGLAMNLHGVERATMDIDIAVALAWTTLSILKEIPEEKLTPAI